MRHAVIAVAIAWNAHRRCARGDGFEQGGKGRLAFADNGVVRPEERQGLLGQDRDRRPAQHQRHRPAIGAERLGADDGNLLPEEFKR